jgi:phosphatidylethanolamine-binding protein (PEBP) family uncharacterized protein
MTRCHPLTLMPALLAVAVMACGSGASTAASPTTPTATVPAPTTAASSMRLTSTVAADGGTLPADYTCDGTGASVPLAWSGAPAGTKEFALLMTTLPGDGTTKWNWVMYGIPATTTSLERNTSGVGTFGVGSDGPSTAYQPPCSQGPGLKLYTFTIYALSASPALSVPSRQVTGAILTSAMANITLGSASLTLGYTRPR